VKGYPFEVVLPASLPISGVILADQVKSLDWRSRRAVWLCRLSHAVLEDILLKLGAPPRASRLRRDTAAPA
jgi:mRNA interferase MazF